jgi:hypothetical protein
MIRTFEERWNVEYLSGVTNEVVELVTVASIHLRKRAEIPEPPAVGSVCCMCGGRLPAVRCFAANGRVIFLGGGAGNKMYNVLQPLYVCMYVLKYRYFSITELGWFVTDILYGSQ